MAGGRLARATTATIRRTLITVPARISRSLRLHPAVQYPAEELKTETSRTAVPIPHSLARELLAHVAQWPGETLLTGRDGGQLPPWALERAVRSARVKLPGLPEGFRYHDLRHPSAKTTLDTYGHLWPDRDESTRAAVDAVLQDHADSARTQAGSR